MDDDLARDLRRLTTLEVSFYRHDDARGWQVLASTLEPAAQLSLSSGMPHWSRSTATHVVAIAGDEHQARVIPLGTNGDVRIVAVLHRSLAGALAAFDRLRNTLFGLAFVSLLISIVASVTIALNITRPLSSLAQQAKRIEQGDYADTVVIERADEIGVLASSLNHMRAGIKDREHRILKLAYQDPLTDLANRSKFSERLEQAIGLAAATRRRVSILMMDLDRFKYVNDTLGHGVGDHVLRQVGERLLAIVSASECVARLGGDEFAILLQSQDRPAPELARDIIADARSSPSSTTASRWTWAPASASRTTPSTATMRRRWCATPTSRCTPRSATRRASPSTTRTTTRASRSICRCSASCGARSSRTSCGCSTSRRCR